MILHRRKIGVPRNKPVYVNVIMQKRRWIVRVIPPETGFLCCEIAPSVNVLSEYLEREYPGKKFNVDYSGLFEIF